MTRERFITLPLWDYRALMAMVSVTCTVAFAPVIFIVATGDPAPAALSVACVVASFVMNLYGCARLVVAELVLADRMRELRAFSAQTAGAARLSAMAHGVDLSGTDDLSLLFVMARDPKLPERVGDTQKVWEVTRFRALCFALGCEADYRGASRRRQRRMRRHHPVDVEWGG